MYAYFSAFRKVAVHMRQVDLALFHWMSLTLVCSLYGGSYHFYNNFKPLAMS